MSVILRNNTIFFANGGGASNGGFITTMSAKNTSTYGFPSSSFTQQKHLTMPSDQKAKLLAMHRDGKANAGIYVAVVLLVYFILVILLLCRYGKRRRTSEPDSTAEQGRLHRLSVSLAQLCDGDLVGCYDNCVATICGCQCSSNTEGSGSSGGSWSCCCCGCCRQMENGEGKQGLEEELKSGSIVTKVEVMDQQQQQQVKRSDVQPRSNANDKDKDGRECGGTIVSVIGDGRDLIMTEQPSSTNAIILKCESNEESENDESGEED